ncbi:fibrinogen gamma chain-like [Pomacea canaliculata]|uniref:fibrinogen gamma chain-like n=1 Tax=Pomacea canaliculata TaxID=400727 RepID=UPI000D72C402|nr:fibrinogen gamma chain-like [Pomacea canaliculata]
MCCPQLLFLLSEQREWTKFCQLFEENNIRSVAKDSRWQTTILLNRIHTLLNLKNMTAITDLTSESRIVSTRYGCYTSCLDHDLCLAFTLYNTNGTTLKCTCHKGSLLSLNKEPSSDLYFISPRAKSILRDEKKTSLAPSFFLKDWLVADCTSDNDCPQKNVVCFKDRCLCLPGFFFSTRDNTCIATCSTADLQNTFMEYPESGIRGHNIAVLDGLTIETCKKLCITTNSCLTVDFRAKGGRCLLHDVTSLTAQVAWYPHTSRGWTHYQRTCMDSSDSYPGPLWYNSPCRNKVDCPDPNSWCLLGRCGCVAGFSLDINDMSCGLESCRDWQRRGVKSGVYSVITAGISTKVWCDMDHGGGWLVFQRRLDGSVDFYRKWTDYEQGFGDVTGEFWLGLYKIHKLTQGRPHRLRVDLMEVSGERHYAEYSAFNVGGPDTKYRLQVSGYSGDAGDSLKVHNNQGFTTHDQDNDNYTTANCAVYYHGAWWYRNCHDSNLNGRYKHDGAVGYDGIAWYYANNDNRGFIFSEMKFKAV